jgi:serine protease Do
MRRTVTLLAVGVGAAIGGAAAVTIGPRLLPQAIADTSGVRPVGNVAELGGLSERFEAVARKLGPAVVSVEAVKPNGTNKDGKQRTVEDAGSGVIIADAGGRHWVITNNHVITGAKSDQISVNLADGRLLRPAQILADPETDVATAIALASVNGSSPSAAHMV